MFLLVCLEFNINLDDFNIALDTKVERVRKKRNVFERAANMVTPAPLRSSMRVSKKSSKSFENLESVSPPTQTLDNRRNSSESINQTKPVKKEEEETPIEVQSTNEYLVGHTKQKSDKNNSLERRSSIESANSLDSESSSVSRVSFHLQKTYLFIL